MGIFSSHWLAETALRITTSPNRASLNEVGRSDRWKLRSDPCWVPTGWQLFLMKEFLHPSKWTAKEPKNYSQLKGIFIFHTSMTLGSMFYFFPGCSSWIVFSMVSGLFFCFQVTWWQKTTWWNNTIPTPCRLRQVPKYPHLKPTVEPEKDAFPKKKIVFQSPFFMRLVLFSFNQSVFFTT